MTQSQEIDGLAEFNQTRPEISSSGLAWDDAGFVGRLLDFVGCSPGLALESAQLHVHRHPRKRKKSKARFLFLRFSALQRPMTQSQEIDGLAEFNQTRPEVSSTSLAMGRCRFWQVLDFVGPLWSQLITRAPATEETEDIQGGTSASFLDIDNEREKFAFEL
ncbi:hypothetical protein MMC22_006939 [Lobaria immixta]|nr:hypothetical protein [Lobaria immixta]